MSRLDKRALAVVCLVFLGCGAMAWVEVWLRPVYPIKSAFKAVFFLGCIGLYALEFRGQKILSVFHRPSRSALKRGVLLAGGVFLFLLGGYAILSPWLDLSAIPGNLSAKEGLTAATFPLAALYITLFNSLLEELFFRGFAFLTLRKAGYDRFAWGFSSGAFALYHVCILDGWLHPFFFLLFTAGLTVGGLLFNALDREGSLWPSWLVHMGANLATNLVGLSLFAV